MSRTDVPVHPLRAAALRIFVQLSPNRFGSYRGYLDGFPLRFDGPTVETVTAKAEAWRADTLNKHEAEYRRRAAVAAAKRKPAVSDIEGGED